MISPKILNLSNEIVKSFLNHINAEGIIANNRNHFLS